VKDKPHWASTRRTSLRKINGGVSAKAVSSMGMLLHVLLLTTAINVLFAIKVAARKLALTFGGTITCSLSPSDSLPSKAADASHHLAGLLMGFTDSLPPASLS
jgi:hypothetical protein